MPDLLALLAPQRCLHCGARGRTPWCAHCAERVRWLPPGCPRCAAPRGASHACWPADAPISATIAVQDYRGPVASAIPTAKLRGARAAWPALAAPLADAVRLRAPAVDVATWVTTPRTRVRARGGDHAKVIAAEVARASELPLLALLAVVEGRHGDGYRATMPLPGTDVLLVDDVLTTGATLWRAAAALHAAGAGRVTVAVIARAGSHPLGAASTVGRRDASEPGGPSGGSHPRGVSSRGGWGARHVGVRSWLARARAR